MNTPSSFLGFAVALATVLLPNSVPALLATDTSDEEQIRIIQTVEAKFPAELSAQGVREGEVRAIMLINADGKLEDCMVTAYSHPAFAVELLNAVRSWEYQPARQNGEPMGQRVQITFNFEQKGAIVSMLPATAIASAMNRFIPTSLTSLVCRASDLDRTPAVRESVSPRHPGKSLTPPVQKGNALIDFYIDAEGRPRMPVAMRATHVEFAAAAAEALMQWRFEPPTQGGRPIAVRMVQEFIF